MKTVFAVMAVLVLFGATYPQKIQVNMEGAQLSKTVELADVTDKLAIASDSIKPAYRKIYPAIVTRDTTGKIISTKKADTVQVPAGPVLAGFSESGVSDYAMAATVPAGSTMRITYILDGQEINSQLIAPKTMEWVISNRVTASLHSGK